MTKISIITPSYNQGRFIRQTIDSVRQQQGSFELEHIVIDGASTDNTVAILQSYGGRILWVSEPDEGQTDALNRGIAMATGDIIGWLNSDDVFEAGCLDSVARVFAEEPETQWVYGKVRIIDESGREIRRWITRYKNFRMRHFRYFETADRELDLADGSFLAAIGRSIGWSVPEGVFPGDRLRFLASLGCEVAWQIRGPRARCVSMVSNQY